MKPKKENPAKKRIDKALVGKLPKEKANLKAERVIEMTKRNKRYRYDKASKRFI
jgi:hypothetical protein